MTWRDELFFTMKCWQIDEDRTMGVKMHRPEAQDQFRTWATECESGCNGWGRTVYLQSLPGPIKREKNFSRVGLKNHTFLSNLLYPSMPLLVRHRQKSSITFVLFLPKIQNMKLILTNLNALQIKWQSTNWSIIVNKMALSQSSRTN